MPATTNFLQVNQAPNAITENDAQYAADSVTTGGLGTGAVVPGAWLDKFIYQISTLARAIGLMMLNKGYSTSDASAVALATVLGNIMTQADMAPYALQSWVNAQGFDTISDVNAKVAGLDSIADVDSKLSGVQSWANGIFAQITSFNIYADGSGYMTFQGSGMIQWTYGSQVYTSGANYQYLSWRTSFPHACLFALAGVMLPTSISDGDIMDYATRSWDTGGVNVVSQRRGDNPAQTIQPWVLGIGY